MIDRPDWIAFARRLAQPVLHAIANEQLRKTMPIEQRPGHHEPRANVVHLEAVGRLLCGLSPWLALGEDAALSAQAKRAIEVGTDPNSPDAFNFNVGAQPLVDAAFLAHAILRAPQLLWHDLDDRSKKNLVKAMISTRVIRAGNNNWLLFSAMVEAFLSFADEKWLPGPIELAIDKHLEWYKGDGAYGDGPAFHWDYYNSYVIQPMLLDVLAEVGRHRSAWADLQPLILTRAQRYAAVQERLIAPDGSFPVIGRSIPYRCGAFQLLAQLALQKKLPAELRPGQVRTALSAVIDRTLSPAGTFDDAGWLRIGLAGHQPSLAENYISTGSLYLASFAFLPLGLPAADPFWTSPPWPFTGQRVWGGEDLPADHAIHE